MTKPESAGILLYRFSLNGELEFFLAHPGGPFWAKKDENSWSIPKGLIEDEDQDYERAARREFFEEIGLQVEAELKFLGAFKQPSGKVVHAWLGQQDVDCHKIVSNEFELEWPRHSGNFSMFPEIDQAQWFNTPVTYTKILKGQVAIIEAAIGVIGYDPVNDKKYDSSGQTSLF